MAGREFQGQENNERKKRSRDRLEEDHAERVNSKKERTAKQSAGERETKAKDAGRTERDGMMGVRDWSGLESGENERKNGSAGGIPII